MNHKVFSLLLGVLMVFLSVFAFAGEKEVQDDKVILEKEYKGWTKFFTYVEKPATKQIREGYINAVGAKAQRGSPFPYGTIFVMEIFNAQVDNKGELIKDASGRLVKGELSKIYVMMKKEGFSVQYVDQPHPTGDWEFRVYDNKYQIAAHTLQETESCRTCHAPAAKTDFVLRYDEFYNAK